MGLAEGDEGLEDFFHVGGIGAEELFRELRGGLRGLRGGEGGFDGFGAVGQCLGPRLFLRGFSK